MSTRAELAAAANSVEGVKAFPYFVSSTSPGTAYVRLERIEYPNPFGGIAHWNVVLILPQDYATAEKYLETKVPLLKTAIEPHLSITSVRPEQLSINGVGTIPVVFLNGHREEDS